jgi:Flp pilus assembly protein TadB
MMSHKLTRILEIVWLSLAILSFLAGLYNWYGHGPGESVMFFVITLLSLMMYFFRRNMRRSKKP